MEILFEHKQSEQPKVSLVLLDWSVRESLHILDYLEHQDVPRESFEVIWIEYYSRRLEDIDLRLNKCAAFDKHPAIDKWIVMNMPADVYYHKHLMYNLGIVVSSGQIITVCDSDAFVRPTFVRSIIEAFEKDRNIVLHMDEFRNVNEKFYPFSYPSFEEVTTLDCINNIGGQPTGIVDLSDPLHLRNYGACMCAMRKDLIAIGGADEHMDYLGHICGPYDMTFRLVNAGKKEIWHPNEWLYHTRHPGQAGEGNYLGPHDGMHMSTTALDVIRTGRVLPLVENQAIRSLRTNGDGIYYSPLISQVIPSIEIDKWKIDKAGWSSQQYWIGDVQITVKERKVNEEEKLRQSKGTCRRFSLTHIWIELMLYRIIFLLTVRQLFFKIRNYFGNKARARSILSDCRLVFVFFRRMWKNNLYTIKACEQVMQRLIDEGVEEVAVYCTGYVARILHILAKEMPFKISSIFDKVMIGEKFLNYEVLPYEALKDCQGRVIIASLTGIIEKEAELEELGIDRKNIVRLQ
ncbi:MAG: hypothetical protein JW720_09380 [Sedimentisphaerales bacterium]|nr:hypothetical protein [Sedimentisphaerales bacterium]